jgi:hypothetical protein
MFDLNRARCSLHQRFPEMNNYVDMSATAVLDKLVANRAEELSQAVRSIVERQRPRCLADSV